VNRASSGHKTGEVPLFSITEAELLKTSPTHLRIKAQVAVPLSIIFTDHSITNSDPDGILGMIARVLASGPPTQGVPPLATHALVVISFRLALGSEKERHDFIQGLVIVRSVCPVPDAVADVFMSQDEIAAISSTRTDEDEIQLSRPTQQFLSLPSPPPPQTYAPLPKSSMQPVSLADHVKWLQLNGGIETMTHNDEGEEDEEDEENDEEGEEMRRSVAFYSTSDMRVSQTTPSSILSAPTGVTSAHASVVSSPLLSLGRPSLNSFAPSPSPVVRLATVNVQPSITPMQMIQQQPYASSSVPSASRVLKPRNVSASSLLAGSGGNNANSAHFNNNNNTSLVQPQQQQHHHHQNQLMSRSVLNNPQNTLLGGGNYPHAIGGTSSAMASSAAIAASVARMNVRGGGGPTPTTSRSGGGWTTGDQQHLGSGLMMPRPQTSISSSSSLRVKETTSIPSLQFSTPFRAQSTQGAPYSNSFSQQRVFFDDVPSVSIGRGPR